MIDPLESLELRISKFLRWGVIVSGLIMLAGWLTQVKGGDPFESFKVYKIMPLSESLSQALQLHQWGVLTCYLGLGVLISLPMIRVLLTAVLFFKQRDLILAAVATFVLVALVISFSLGIEI